MKLSFETGSLAKKNPGICIPGSLPSKLLSLDLLRPFRLEKREWFRTDSGTSYRLSKSKTSLSSRKAYAQLEEYLRGHRYCQRFPARFPQSFELLRLLLLPASNAIRCALGAFGWHAWRKD